MNSISIIIPAYNESKRILPTLEGLVDFFSGFMSKYEIIVVDDGSTDGTSELVKEFASGISANISVVQLDLNCGKGMAVKRGVEKAENDIVFFVDADQSYGPENIAYAVKEFEDPGISMLIGDRNLKDSRIINPPPMLRTISGKIYSLLVQSLVLPGITDSQCGFKAFRRECAVSIFKRITIFRFGFDVEVLYIAKKLGYKIKKIPITCRNTIESRVRLINDSLRMFSDLFTIRANDKKGLYL